MIIKPAVAKHKYNLDGTAETTRQLATTAGREIVSVLVTPGSADTVVRIHDSSNGATGSVNSFLIEADNAAGSFAFTPPQPVPMRNGIYIDMELGGPEGGECFILYN